MRWQCPSTFPLTIWERTVACKNAGRNVPTKLPLPNGGCSCYLAGHQRGEALRISFRSTGGTIHLQFERMKWLGHDLPHVKKSMIFTTSRRFTSCPTRISQTLVSSVDVIPWLVRDLWEKRGEESIHHRWRNQRIQVAGGILYLIFGLGGWGIPVSISRKTSEA